MQENGQQQLPEAPASGTVSATSPNGFSVLFTIRDHDAGALFTRLQGPVGYLEQSGYTPPAQPAWKRKGPPAAAAPDDGSAPQCPDHKSPMRSGKFGWFCPRKLDSGEYCPHKAR